MGKGSLLVMARWKIAGNCIGQHIQKHFGSFVVVVVVADVVVAFEVFESLQLSHSMTCSQLPLHVVVDGVAAVVRRGRLNIESVVAAMVVAPEVAVAAVAHGKPVVVDTSVVVVVVEVVAGAVVVVVGVAVAVAVEQMIEKDGGPAGAAAGYCLHYACCCCPLPTCPCLPFE